MRLTVNLLRESPGWKVRRGSSDFMILHTVRDGEVYVLERKHRRKSSFVRRYVDFFNQLVVFY